MAYTKSGIFVVPMVALFKATSETGGQFNFTLNTYKISLLDYATTVDGAAPVAFSGTAAWVNTHESTGTGWVTTGYAASALATGSADLVPTIAEGTTGSLRHNWTNPLSKASTTLTGVGGMICYADPVSAPVAKPMLYSVCFGTGYSTVSGTFGVTPSATGIFEIDFTP